MCFMCFNVSLVSTCFTSVVSFWPKSSFLVLCTLYGKISCFVIRDACLSYLLSIYMFAFIFVYLFLHPPPPPMHIRGIQSPSVDWTDRQGHTQQYITGNNAETHCDVIKPHIPNEVYHTQQMFSSQNRKLVPDCGKQLTVESGEVDASCAALLQWSRRPTTAGCICLGNYINVY